MKLNYLFPNKFKKIGWLILIPSFIIGLFVFFNELEPVFFEFEVLAIKNLFSGNIQFGLVENNILNEILGILIIISSLLVAFSKEKMEDEYVSKIRLESLVWAVFFNYLILLFSFLFIFDIDFLSIMVFNMFTVLIFFIIRFKWQIYKLKKSLNYAE